MSAVMEHKPQAVVPASNDVAAVMQVIERAAANPDVDVAKLEKLLDMQERIFDKNAEIAFNGAMAEMQAELPEITERGVIKITGRPDTRYARFEDINDAVKPILQRHGFAISFRIDSTNGKVKVTGILVHRAGHREETTMELPVDGSGSKNAVQAVGSSVSYGKRYVIEAILNLTSRGQDDDGRTGGGAPIPDEAGKKALEACMSIPALEAAWKALTKEQRATLSKVKDDCKAMIEDARKRGV
jgi:hypothetical protein